MYATMASLVDDLEAEVSRGHVVPWASPVPFFGDIQNAVVATVGINPSNREFVDSRGLELIGAQRRLPTLESMGLQDWSSASGWDIRSLVVACENYFIHNPYRGWFDILERMLNAGGYSYYGTPAACHLDLVAYATQAKWGKLTVDTRTKLIGRGRSNLAKIIRDSPLEVLVLNGRSVVDEFMRFAETGLTQRDMREWSLPRGNGQGVVGVAFEGVIDNIGGVALDRDVVVIGYNHNLQSSFGVTREVINEIGKFIGGSIVKATTGSA